MATTSGDSGTAADAGMSFERARDELAQVVAALEAGGLTLEESLALWERGEQLAAVCQEWLDSARERVVGEPAGDATSQQ